MDAEKRNNNDNLVVIDYRDIIRDTGKDLAPLLAKAFGGTEPLPNGDENSNNETVPSSSSSSSRCDSLGIIAIRNVPNFINAKDAFLPLAYQLAHLPQSYLEKSLTDERSLYNAGWSHGKEKLGDKPDYAKGSFYFNPLTDTPGSEEDRARYPASYPCNIWPDESAIPGFEVAAKHLGSIMHGVVVHLSKHIDAYAKSKSSSYPDNLLYEAMKQTEKAKGRLLYYFPLDNGEEKDDVNNAKDDADIAEDSWIGWHNDSGFLTALAGDMYINHETGEHLNSQSIDPNAGLYVLNRNGTKTHVVIPEDCMAVQLGECVQIITGGAVIATPHCVRGAKNSNVSGSTKIARISHPCFIDTVPSFPLSMPSGVSRDDVIMAGVEKNAPVPPLDDRWIEDGMTFGDFLQKTFSMYYDWSTKDNTK